MVKPILTAKTAIRMMYARSRTSLGERQKKKAQGKVSTGKAVSVSLRSQLSGGTTLGKKIKYVRSACIIVSNA